MPLSFLSERVVKYVMSQEQLHLTREKSQPMEFQNISHNIMKIYYFSRQKSSSLFFALKENGRFEEVF